MTNHNQENFIRLCIEHNILRFGEFTLKSGRVSPYFFNAGLFHNGLLASELANAYATVIAEHFNNDIMLYGPAYKGIPLAATTAVALYQQHQLNIDFCFNRKEVKDHGEGGQLVGAELKGDVVILDDVITAGTSVHESVDIIKAAGANPAAVIIAVDRQEIADNEHMAATQKVSQQYQIPVYSIISLDQLISFLQYQTHQEETLKRIQSYRQRYAVQAK